MNKEGKEEYKMVSANEASDPSGPRFKSTSKRRMFIVIGIVCLLLVVAVAIALGVYFGVQGCQMDKITLTVKSSDCNTSVADVTITSSADLTITEKQPGIYLGEVCGMPATLSIQKEGFELLTTTVTSPTETVTMICSEPLCTVQIANISVTSTCATPHVNSVSIRGQNVIDVTSSTPGSYQITVCSLLTLVDVERNGYASQRTTLSSGSNLILMCDSPIITKDPQSKYRREGENVTLCCQTEPATGVIYKWYKDGTELTSETNNELSLTALTSDDQGWYQCTAKLTADSNLPAVRSGEAMLTIRATSDNCYDAWRPRKMEIFPGCYYDVGRCLKRSCRSTGSEEACSDDNVCCEVTETVYPDCALGKNVTKVLRCSCSCPTPSVIIVRGTVQDSDTGLPLTGITVTIVGTTFNTTTDVNGDYSLNTVPSLRRRLVAKVSDSAGDYLDNYVVKTIPGSESFDKVHMNVAMIRKAPFITIDPVIENTLSISGDPSTPNNSSAYLKVPANAFYNIDGTQFTKRASVSLTYIDPSERLEDAPGQFITLNQYGQPDILVTLGVFSIEFVDDSGNQLLLNDNIEVFAKGLTPYMLWQLEEQTGTWVLMRSLPRRKKRQETQDRLIGTFIPQLGRWYNLDFIVRVSEGPCFFKIRVFHGQFSEENEVTSTVEVFPEIRQILGISNVNAVRYLQEESLSGCFTIMCPSELARISISVPPSIRYVERFRSIRTPLRPAAIEDYISSIKIIFQLSRYNYTLSSKNPNMLYVNTQMAEIGPFYPDIKSCEASTFQDPAFWFAEPPVFVESNFYDISEERCVGKFRIYIRSVRMLEVYDKLANFEIDALSVWSDNKYSVKVASAKRIPPPYISQNSSIIYPPQDGSDFHIYALSCVEYRCSSENDKTTVYFSFAKVPFLNCYKDTFSPPILNSSKVQEDYFLNRMSNAEEAIGRCENDTTWDSHGGAGLLRCYDPKWFNG